MEEMLLHVGAGEHGGAQCGICTPGIIMAALALGSKLSLQEIRVALAGNLCRCTGYAAIYRSIAAANRRASSQLVQRRSLPRVRRAR
jgi:aerobic-type carbon monoxide dehydrogenase small subunit (CoxS/CutS family)